VQYLDGRSTFPYAAEEGRLTFEAIVGMNASHHKDSALVDLPWVSEHRKYEVLSG
jgi:hypothetical protein|tara:strand:- start:289 stop:453 length:165 start_codon:yes stop_codon:yes gene_type:complete